MKRALAYRGVVSDTATGEPWTTRFRAAAWVGLSRVRAGSRRGSAAARSHLKDHAYTWLAMGFIDAACYVHSLFIGLLVTGILFFLFELKVGDSD
jgi:hypothetical protein